MSKTINVCVSILYKAWIDDTIRKKWLKDKIIFRKTTLDKSARITWSDNITSLSVDFYPKAENKSQVVVQHLKLPDVAEADDMKQYWAKTLELLKSILEA